MRVQNIIQQTNKDSPEHRIPVLHAHNLGKQFGKEWALRDCSFSLLPGQVVALVGSNGAGKTTLLNMISGQLCPSTGQITINGYSLEDRYTVGPANAFRVAMVSQEKPLYSHFTVAEMLRFGRSVNRVWDEKRAINWLRHFDIPLTRRCGKLSGGQQALVALALAIGASPPIMLLDEPLANLDPLIRAEVIQQLLLTIAETNATILLSTHVVTELTGVADYLLLLTQGKLILQGNVDQLISDHCYQIGPRTDQPPGNDRVIHATHTDNQSTFLVRRDSQQTAGNSSISPSWLTRDVDLSELLLAYLRSDRSARHGTPAANGEIK